MPQPGNSGSFGEKGSTGQDGDPGKTGERGDINGYKAPAPEEKSNCQAPPPPPPPCDEASVNDCLTCGGRYDYVNCSCYYEDGPYASNCPPDHDHSATCGEADECGHIFGFPTDCDCTEDDHDHSGICGSVDSCGHGFGADTDCGCPNAPIVWDTCEEWVCDADETNCRWESYPCNPHPCQ